MTVECHRCGYGRWPCEIAGALDGAFTGGAVPSSYLEVLALLRPAP